MQTLMARLRDPDTGCPWDTKQTFSTIVPFTIEEAYEVADAIESEDFEHLPEELGDLLFQVIFYAQLGKEQGWFTFDKVVHSLVAKLVRRHPHVFPDGTLESVKSDQASQMSPEQDAEIKQRWEAIKAEERESKGAKGLLDDVPVSLPAITRAAKLQKRAASIGFDGEGVQAMIEKLEEEVAELKAAVKAQQDHHNEYCNSHIEVHDSIRDSIKEELGDTFFSLVNVARHLKVDSEAALRSANRKFENRIRYMEASAQEAGQSLNSLSLSQLDALWESAKQNECEKE
nr:nucleoside triphosphate pyrophosphohydrolase [Marinibactrum halimedae]